MNNKQLEILTRVPKIKVEDLENKSDRTLLYGKSGNSCPTYYHLYLKDDMFHFTIYPTNNYDTDISKVKSFKFRDEITTDIFHLMGLTLYPECSDYEFCGLLKSKGIIFDYEKIDPERVNKKFYGILYEDLNKK